MGKPTGFLEYDRFLPPDRPVRERIGDWQEFRGRWTDEQASCQGARCMDCGIPWCHTGIMLGGAASGCPINNLIPEFNDLIYRGQWRQALARLLRTNNFPEFTGRVCPAPCEGACTVGMHLLPVAIKQNECAIIDRAFAEGWITAQPPLERTGKTVAIAGSGPSGLACADQLNRAGHKVTVFERDDRIGGLLMYGIPNMKLDKSIVQRRVDLLREEGVVFETNCEIGKDIPVSKLQAEYSATVLCCGATRPRDLNIPGRDLPGIHFAMEFLRASTGSLLSGGMPPDTLNAQNKDVIVIGGGDTGTDCVATSIRQGCRSITQLEIMPRPADNRPPNNPWPEWPRILKTDYGQEEAIEIFGQDPRVYQTTAVNFTSGDSGKISSVNTMQVNWEKNDQGRPVPRPVTGTGRELPAQLVLLAMGFLGPEDASLRELAIRQDQRSNVLTEPNGYQTSHPGVFTAGDMRRGQSLVVWAIQEGRRAARACDAWLMGRVRLPE